MSEDDDWFERALREEDADAEADREDLDADSGEPDPTGRESESTDGEPEPTDGDGELTGSEPDASTPEDSENGGFGDAPEFDAEDDAGLGETDATGFGEAEDFGMGDSTSEESDAPGDSSADGFADADPYGGDEQSSSNNRPKADDADEPSSSDSRPKPADADEEGTDLFGEDFATAFENAPGGGSGGSGTGGGGGAGAGAGGAGAGGAGAGGAGAGGTGAGEGGGLDSGGGGFDAGGGGFDAGSSGGGFDGGGGGGFGMDASEQGGFGDSGDTFDDEEFESNIPRIDVGIEGLDDMIQGGVPERSLMTTIGSAGTGKTTFGLQFLHEALVQGENAVFITLEESHDRIVSTATEKGWDFDEYEDEGSLAVIDLDPIEMANSLTSIRNDLPRLVEEFGATRLVLDSVSLLEMMYDNQATRRNEVYDFTKSLKEAGVTTMLTSEASQDTPYASRHGIIEYLVDAVFVLRYIRSSDDFRETRLAVEIQKIRDANHSREIKPYSITNEGISVYRQANIF